LSNIGYPSIINRVDSFLRFNIHIKLVSLLRIFYLIPIYQLVRLTIRAVRLIFGFSGYILYNGHYFVGIVTFDELKDV